MVSLSANLNISSKSSDIGLNLTRKEEDFIVKNIFSKRGKETVSSIKK